MMSKQAFTLIELLVVVLIIGILAAIAVPQYQKAVEKARAAELVTFLTETQRALDIYILEHGFEDKTFYNNRGETVVDNLAELDIDLSALVQKLVQTYEYEVQISLYSISETVVSITTSSMKAPTGQVYYALVEGEWGGYCDQDTGCEYIHQHIPDIWVHE